MAQEKETVASLGKKASDLLPDLVRLLRKDEGVNGNPEDYSLMKTCVELIFANSGTVLATEWVRNRKFQALFILLDGVYLGRVEEIFERKLSEGAPRDFKAAIMRKFGLRLPPREVRQ